MADATLKMILLGQDRGASRAIKGVGDQAERTERKSHHMGAAFAKAGKLAAIGLGAGAALGAAALVKMVKGAAEDEAAQKRLATTLKNTAGATRGGVKDVESWISKMGVATGVTDDDMRPALDRLVRSTHDVGKAQDLTKLAMDASAGTGKNLESVAGALAKAHDGNTGALGKLGIATKDASGKALSFDKITQNMAKTFKGQAAAHAGTLEGKMGRLKLVLSEAGESIGAKLIPKLTDLATWVMDKAVPAIQEFFDQMKSGEGTAGKIADVLGVVGDVLGTVFGFLAKHAGTVLTFVGILGGMTLAFAALNAVMAINPISLVILAIAALATGLVMAYRKSETFRKIVDGAMHAVARIVLWLWNNAYQPAMKGIVTAIGWVLKAIGKMLSALGHIPGFGWAKKAGDAMQTAGNKAIDLADGIKKIKSKSVTVKVTYREKRYSSNSGVGGADQYSYHNAVGTSFWRGGGTMVGERGRAEYAEFPRGTKITPDSQMRRASSTSGDFTATQPIVLQLDGKKVWHTLLEVKRRNGNISMGLA